MRSKKWNITPANPDLTQKLAEALKTNPILAQILVNRGIVDPESARQYLNPNLKYLHDPNLMPGIPLAAKRLAQAIKNHEKIVIYGDYDVDGITGTSILWHAIRILGHSADYYIPHRLDEGYGLNSDAVSQICDNGCQLLISVDCGVTALEQAEICQAKKVDLVVTDHHDWKRDDNAKALIPECHAIAHPRLFEGYPNPNLCGAGVAFKLAWALGREMSGADKVNDAYRNFLLEALSLAAMGTIADVVPLIGENRLIAHFGLLAAKDSKLVGLQSLIETAGLAGKPINSYHVGFQLAPRINAAGRMGHAAQAVEMLTHAAKPRADEIAREMDKQNRDRQDLEKQIYREALEQATKLGMDQPAVRGVVLGMKQWHPGVIGIVASRVVSKLNKPTIMISLDEVEGHGSGRSIPGFHLAQALDACRECLISSGGHEMAAGLRLSAENFENFRQQFNDYALQHVTDDMLVPHINLDCLAPLNLIDLPLVEDLKRLGPFGSANHKPLICCQDVELVAEPNRVGKTGDHVQLMIRQNGLVMKCIAFNRGELADQIHKGAHIDLAVEPSINEYNGYRNIELQVVDLQIR